MIEAKYVYIVGAKMKINEYKLCKSITGICEVHSDLAQNIVFTLVNRWQNDKLIKNTKIPESKVSVCSSHQLKHNLRKDISELQIVLYVEIDNENENYLYIYGCWNFILIRK